MNSFNALILKKRIYKDSDLVLTILSEQNVKIELLAKAALKTTSKKSSKIDVLNFVYVTTVQGRLHNILTEIRVVDNFQNLKSGNNIFLVWWFSEVLEKLTGVMDSNSYEFENLMIALRLAESQPDKSVLILSYSILQLLLQSGVNVNFTNFLQSGVSIIEDSDKFLAFDSNNMGFAEDYNRTIGVDNTLYKVLKFLTSESIDKIVCLELTSDQKSELLKVVTLWVENLCGSVIVSKKLI